MSVLNSPPTLVVDHSLSDTDSNHRRVRDISLLCLAIAILILSFVSRVHENQRVMLIGFDWLPVPETCGSRLWFGLECPGCGLTRGFIRLAAGDWRGAMALNRVVPLMALAVMIQIPYRILSLLSWPLARRFGDSIWPAVFGWVLIVALFGNWLLKLGEI